MPRIRTNFAAEALYAGPAPATGYHWISGSTLMGTNTPTYGTGLVKQLHRVQDASYGFSLPKKDLLQFGQAGYIERALIDSPQVNFQFSYIQANFTNEKNLGFTITSGATPVSALSGFLTKATDDRNYFAKDTSEGTDNINNTSPNYVIYGFGNCALSSYTANAAVGDFPKASVQVQGLNVLVQSTVTGDIPAVNPTDGTAILNRTFALPFATGSAGPGPLSYSTLLPGDINLSLDFNDIGVDTTDWKIQNYSLTLNLNRDPIKKLGSKYEVSKELQIPINVQMSINAIIGDTKTGNLADVIKCGADGYNVKVSLNKPQCTNNVLTLDSGVAIQYELKNASLESENFGLNVGGNKTVDLVFVCPVTGPQDAQNGLFMSGIN